MIVHFGDSITYSMAYFAPLQYSGKAKMPPDARGHWIWSIGT